MFGRALTTLGTWTARPTAFGIVLVYAAAWLALDHASFDWHAVATLATWLMTLVIQRAEHRDTQAIHAKLDELLSTHGATRSELSSIDEREPEEIERHRNER